MKTAPIKIAFELTDTFGGEANYAWVKRHQEEIDPYLSDLAIVRRAKRWAGLSGVRCEVDNCGSSLITIRPRGMCQVLFVNLWS